MDHDIEQAADQAERLEALESARSWRERALAAAGTPRTPGGSR